VLAAPAAPVDAKAALKAEKDAWYGGHSFECLARCLWAVWVVCSSLTTCYD